MWQWVADLKILDWLGILGTLLGVFGIVYSFYTNRQAREIEALNATLTARLKTVEWTDIRNFAEDTIKYLGSWRPDVVYCPDLRGGVVGYLLISQMHMDVPIFVGHIYPLAHPVPDINIGERYSEISTPKYKILIDKYLYKYKGRKILIVDEIAITGEATYSIKNHLINNGFSTNDVRAAIVVVCTAAVSSGRSPDFGWRTSETEDVTFPWGKWG